MAEGLYTNRNARQDFIRDAIIHHAKDVDDIYVAVPFFTQADLIKELLKGKHIRLIIRLGFPTAPEALKELMELKNIELRFFTAPEFHTKLYIFGNEVAMVGSANLTRAAVWTNSEVMVTIGSDDERFLDLADLFAGYWEDAKVLTKDELEKYAAYHQKLMKLRKEIEDLDNSVMEKLGKVVAKNVNRGKTKETKEAIYLESYRKTYQEATRAFDVIRDVYEEVGQRRIPETELPLRLEIDSFISFIREGDGQGDAWKDAPPLSGEIQRAKIRDLVREWLVTPWPYLQETVVREKYPRIKTSFASADSIMALSDDDLFDALTVAHSFEERFRFYLGSTPTQKREFFKHNDGKRIRETLAYLLFGKDETVRRLANVIYNEEYKLKAFGQASTQEILGWAGSENLPVINGRTTKVLKYLGFRVQQL